MAGYTKQDTTGKIANGNIVDADDFNDEFNTLQTAFGSTGGHDHSDTSSGNGAPITKAGADHRYEFGNDALIPKNSFTSIDVGSSTRKFDNAHFGGKVNSATLETTGAATLNSLVVGSSTAVTSVDTDLSSVAGTDTTLASAKAIKTYVDAQITAEDLDITTDSGTIAIDLDSETFTIAGGTGISTSAASNTVTITSDDANIDHDSLNNFVANEHINHTSVSVTAGNGLTGGGNISATRTLTVDPHTGIAVTADGVALSHLGLQDLTDPNADRVAFWDDSAGKFDWLTMGTNLAISGTTLNATDTNTDTNTTYTAGTGLTLDGTTFNVTITDTNTTYTAGTGLTLTGTVFSSDATQTINTINSAGFTLDSSGDITFDADGNDFIFKNGAGGDTATLSYADNGLLQLSNAQTLQLTTTASGADVQVTTLNRAGGLRLHSTASSTYNLILGYGDASNNAFINAAAGLTIDANGGPLVLETTANDTANDITLNSGGGNVKVEGQTVSINTHSTQSDGYALQVDKQVINSIGISTYFLTNAYYNSGYKYISNGKAMRLDVGGGSYIFRTAASNSSGADAALNTWSTRATISESGLDVPGTITSGALEPESISIHNTTSPASIYFQQDASGPQPLSKFYIILNGAPQVMSSDTAYMHIDNGTINFKPAGGVSGSKVNISGALSVTGAVSKGSGSFKIDHPLPAKADTHHLVHSFIEGPQADLIYRGRVALVDSTATVDIDIAAGMTDGTFVALCEDVQCFTSNESGWASVKGSVSGNTLTITAQDNACTDTISWMVVGERKDPHMLDAATDWTDSQGKVIVEPAKPAE